MKAYQYRVTNFAHSHSKDCCVIEGVLLQAEDEALDALVTARLPQDHPYYKQVSVSVDAVKSNPFWSYKQKEVFVNRLVKDMHAAL